MRDGDLWCESTLNTNPETQKPRNPLQAEEIWSVSNLCGCRVGVLAAGGSSDAVSLEDLLGVLQNGLVAELQVELERQSGEFVFNQRGVRSHFKKDSACHPDLLLQHVLPLLPHLLHQQGEVRDPVPSLQLLQRSVQQTEGAGASHARAERHRKQHMKKIRVPFHNSSRAEPRFPAAVTHLQCTTTGVCRGLWWR